MVGHDYPANGPRSECLVRRRQRSGDDAGQARVPEPVDALVGNRCDQVGVSRGRVSTFSQSPVTDFRMRIHLANDTKVGRFIQATVVMEFVG